MSVPYTDTNHLCHPLLNTSIFDENERVDDGSFGRVVGDGWSAAAPSTSGKPNLDEDDSRSAYAPYYKYDQQYKV